MTSEWFACLILYIFCPAQILLEQHLIEVKLGKTADTRPSKNQTLVVLLLKQRRHILSLKYPVRMFSMFLKECSSSAQVVERYIVCSFLSLCPCSACLNTHMYRTALNMKSRQDGNLYYS